MSDSVVRKCPAVRFANGRKEEIEDPVAVETEVTLFLNGHKYILYLCQHPLIPSGSSGLVFSPRRG
ncbi:MAG TPA: hypothetical protein O0Y08_06235 [Methanocorpusculum sp.]|nr:hypothetical protein [Methanocorpusculum sp.]HJJ60436.1 hypothetical protein [Methanocorpusculum sp.]